MTRPGPSPAHLRPWITEDGSFSLHSTDFDEGFHCRSGALREARRVFVEPAQLERFAPGDTIRVVDVCVGLGTNSAALLEAAAPRGLSLRWYGLELDPAPLALALAEPSFRHQWQDGLGLDLLLQVRGSGPWCSPHGTGEWCSPHGTGELLWGDARSRVDDLLARARGRCDLVMLDAFSPRRCPQLWTQEFLGKLAALLAPRGRLLTYCSAAAPRRSLQDAGLTVAALHGEAGTGAWSQGTIAGPCLPEVSGSWRPLTPMEREHLASRAGEPYRDPQGNADAARILQARDHAQAHSTAEPASAWRRRWRLPKHGVLGLHGGDR